MPVHFVKQGDCMNTIACQYGFFWETLWNHERNAELKKKRQDPNVLMAGDQVFIRDKRVKEESGATGQTHTFRLKGVPVKLRFQLVDFDGSPRAGEKYTLTVDGSKRSGVTGEDGEISEVIPPQAKKAKLEIIDTGEEYDFDLGHVNPVEYASGVQARLKNLGYYKGEITSTLDDETKEAIRRFQRAHGLPETGDTDSQTLDLLRETHLG
jgi:N-acetylmuramoyl-L-alanine amidase